jgi:hypothetical protein
VLRDPGSPGTDKLILLYMKTESRNAREVFTNCDKSQLRRQLIALVARSANPETVETGGEDGQARIEEIQCGGSDGRAGSPGKASSSIPARTDTRESFPLIDV